MTARAVFLNAGLSRILNREIYFDGVDQRHQPLQKRLMYRMAVVGIESGLICEFHHTADNKALSARRNIFPDVRFQDQRNVIFQRADFAEHAFLLRFGDVRLQAKCKHVDEHLYVSFVYKKDLKILGDGARLCQ
jgi:hypothetical protein